MANLQNLTPYKKGHKSTGGRPKGSLDMVALLKKYLDTDYTNINKKTGKKETKKFSEWVVIALIKQAAKGNVLAVDKIFDRINGRVATELKGKLTLDVKKLSDEELEDIVNGN